VVEDLVFLGYGVASLGNTFPKYRTSVMSLL